ncbi:MAG: arsenate reductase ArsC [Dehalococcoidales bacterium]|nr:arsenate reductase ArsC [Dehalococcoidales bacterium]
MKTVLFVCVHNAGRSQMAEAFFNHLAKGRAQAYSAGTQPSSLNPVVVEAMRETGIDISKNRPKLMTWEMAEQADRVITMGCGGIEGACPGPIIQAEDWGLEDPQGKSIEVVRKIRDEIKGRVSMLLDEIEPPESSR